MRIRRNTGTAVMRTPACPLRAVGGPALRSAVGIILPTACFLRAHLGRSPKRGTRRRVQATGELPRSSCPAHGTTRSSSHSCRQTFSPCVCESTFSFGPTLLWSRVRRHCSPAAAAAASSPPPRAKMSAPQTSSAMGAAGSSVPPKASRQRRGGYSAWFGEAVLVRGKVARNGSGTQS